MMRQETTVPTNIFISYRRADSADVAGRVYDALAATFGRQSIFMDVDNLPFGADFRSYLRAVLGQSQVVLAIIGNDWVDIRDRSGARRLDAPSDWVRLVIETAFTLGLTVIPVLVSGARMPSAADLPPSLQPLAYRNAVVVRNDPDFSHDIQQLTDVVSRFVPTIGPSGQSRWGGFLGVFKRRSPAPRDATRSGEPATQWPQDDAEVTPRAEPAAGGQSPAGQSPAGPPLAGLPPEPAMTSQGQGIRIFISYKNTDRSLVTALAFGLAEERYVVWFDQQLVGGHSWWDEILQNIREAGVFLFALTPASLESVPCQREYGYAHALHKRILPVQIADGVDMRLLPPALQRIQVVDYRALDGSGWPRLKDALLKLPPAAAMPDVLPSPPPAPISALGALKEQMDQPTLTKEQQAYLLVELKTLMKTGDTADGAHDLLKKFRYHPDLRAAIADEIKELIG